MVSIFGSLIQSDFGGDHGNFEAVVRIDNELWHYFRDNEDRGQPWRRTKRIATDVADAGAIIQSNLGAGDHGNFEVVVPLSGAAGRIELWHFVRDNTDPGGEWRRIGRVTEAADHVKWPASIIQGTFGMPDNFEVVVPLLNVDGSAELWHFFRDNSDSPPTWKKVRQVTMPGDVVVGPGSIIQSSRGPDRNNFEVVVPVLGPEGRPELRHYFHDNSNLGSAWVKAGQVTGPADMVAAGGGGVIVESDFRDGEGRGNFEVVVPLARPTGHIEMWHFFQETDPGSDWRPGGMITASARLGAGFITSDYGVNEHDHRNFEILVEECKRSVVHYFRYNGDVANPWLRTAPTQIDGLPIEAANRAGTTHKICQLTGEFDLEGWTKAVVGELTDQQPALASHGGRLFLAWKGLGNNQLNLMFSDDSGRTFRGKRTLTELSDHAPALAEHNNRLFLAWRGLGNGKLNVAKVTFFATTAGGFSIEGLEGKVVLGELSERSPALAGHGGRLFLGWTGVGNGRLNLMFSDDNGATYRGKRTLGDLSDRAPALASHHSRLYLAWKGSGNERLNVARVGFFATTAGGFGIENLEQKVVLSELTEQAPALASHRDRLFLAWRGVGVGNFHLNLLFSEDDGATFRGKPRIPDATDYASALASHGVHPDECLFWAWKAPRSLPSPPVLLPGGDQLNIARIAAPALTAGRTVFAHNRTEARASIRGTDLGTALIHNSPQLPGQERLCFLFGDTWRVNQTHDQVNLDAVAFSTDRKPEDGLDLAFNAQSPLITSGSVKQGEFEVPLDGVSFRDRMFVFFTSDHYMVAHHNLVRRSVVASSGNDGREFVLLREFSRDRFLNVSLDQADGNQVGLPTFGRTLLIWGSGRYRSSDVYLAAMPLEEIASGRFVRFFAGTDDGRPMWVNEEARAVPLFPSGSIGELSVRRIEILSRWLVLYRSDNPQGILLRSAETPWGPWTDPVVLFHNDDGLGKFIHRGWDAPNNQHDFMHDGIIPVEDDPSRSNHWGDAYAPGLIAPLTQGAAGSSADIYFTMSTWNPYQVVLMKTTLRVGGPELPPLPPMGLVETRTLVVPRLEIHGTTPF